MFIKYGSQEHLKALKERGEIFFNPCKYYRDLEEEEKKKGIGDGNDGGLHTEASKVYLIGAKGVVYSDKASSSIIVEPALNTPVFCLRKSETEYITAAYREKLRDQFSKHTHALIIKDERAFLENVRYNFRSKAFAHSVFYQDQYFIDFFNFLKSGSSDVAFYSTKRRGHNYYKKMIIEPDDKSLQRTEVLIDDSNFYKTMYKKDSFFRDQSEYRIVLPHQTITTGQKFKIAPVEATLCNIDELIRDVFCTTAQSRISKD